MSSRRRRDAISTRQIDATQQVPARLRPYEGPPFALLRRVEAAANRWNVLAAVEA